MTVKENLEMGAYPKRSWRERKQTLKWYTVFPASRGTLQATFADAHAAGAANARHGSGLMSKARMVLVDEPSNGLAPLVVSEVFEILSPAQGKDHDSSRRAERPPDATSRPCYSAREWQAGARRRVSFLRETDHVRRVYLGL